MTIRIPLITASIALALAAPAAAGAAHGNRTKSIEIGSSTRNTVGGSYVHMPATSTSPSTYIDVNACQLTGLCTGVFDPGTSET